MRTNIDIFSSKNWDAPEVEIRGSSSAIAEFGRVLQGVTDVLILEAPVAKNEFDVIGIPQVSLNPLGDTTNRLSISVDEHELRISGSTEALRKLGRIIERFFKDGTEIGENFQLFYYPENQLLNETNCELTFLCDR